MVCCFPSHGSEFLILLIVINYVCRGVKYLGLVDSDMECSDILLGQQIAVVATLATQ